MNVLIAGDFAPKARLAKQIKEKRFDEIFSENLRNVIKSADFSFVNFESPVVEDGYKPITKCGPNLSCIPEAVESVKYAGFTSVTLANNHILDFGSEGLRKTVECSKSQGLDVVGVGENLKDAEKVLYLEKEGKKLAVINCCEHEFSIATESDVGANPLNPIRQFYTIKEAKKNTDYVLVIVHGGHEYYQLPSPRMQETYRFFIDAGADAIVNHHQHCFSGYEIYKGKPIFYGLGNFGFDEDGMRAGIWNEGYLLKLNMEDVSFELHPYVQYDTEATIILLSDTESFQKRISELNEIIANDNALKIAADDYYSSTSRGIEAMYQPYESRILRKLYLLKFLPSLMSKKRFINIYNYINCESHRDKQLYAFKAMLNKK